VILQAWLDDSGSGSKRQRVFVLAGFVSDHESWATFSEEWREALNEPPSIPFFKMNHAYNPRSRNSVFHGWSRFEVNKKVEKLISIIKYRVMVRISSTMRLDDYEKYIKRRVLPSVDSPYFFCLYQILYAVAAHQKKYGWNFKTDFFFDEQGSIGENTKEWHSIFKQIASDDIRPYIGSTPIFRDDKKFMPLQAADLYAGAMRRHAFENTHLYLPMRSELRALADFGLQNIEREIDADHLREWISLLPLNIRYPR
jgi:hypothetical protein